MSACSVKGAPSTRLAKLTCPVDALFGAKVPAEVGVRVEEDARHAS